MISEYAEYEAWKPDRMTNIDNMWKILPDYLYGMYDTPIRTFNPEKSAELINEIIKFFNEEEGATRIPYVSEIIRPIEFDPWNGFDWFWAMDENGRIGKVMACEMRIGWGRNDPPEYVDVIHWIYPDGTEIREEW